MKVQNYLISFFIGAANGDDTLYIFENTWSFFNASSVPEDLEMRDIMSKLWTSFAITG